MKPIVWNNCYDQGWRGMIVPKAFAHPAKFSRALIARILSHGLEVGWFQRGDVLGDPFGGVALGGLMAAYAGLGWVGCELEPKFIGLGNANIELHARRLASIGAPLPVLLQGDSRQFAEIVGGVGAVVTSPPFGERTDGGAMAHDGQTSTRPLGRSSLARELVTLGQIEGLASGSVDAVLTNPPYAESVHDGNGIDLTKIGRKGGPNSQAGANGYGASDGQIGALCAGSIDAVVTSPPYAETDVTAGNVSNAINKTWGSGTRIGGRVQPSYGVTDGQIGSLAAGNLDGVVRSESTPETYWEAVAQVYTQCRLALRPDGIMCVVVKDYIKNKTRFPLCDQTLALLVSLGFTPVARIHAMLVKEQSHDGFFGQIVKRKSRKSFFRRLAESKGSPKIDWEEVLVVRRPHDCCEMRQVPEAGGGVSL